MSRERAGWFSGAATRGFPVAVGTPLAGYVARTGSCIGVCDELTVGALVLGNDDRRIAIVSADIAAVDEELVGDVAAMAGLDRAELVVCASHTHSGPAGVVPRLHPADADRGEPALRAAFVAACTATLADARRRLEPVELLVGATDTAGLASNRNDADGPYDRRLSILATRALSGDLRSVLVHFACHPTILGADSRLVSADFPGALRRALRALPHARARSAEILYLNGAAGDISTRYSRRGQDMAEVERVGAGLATAAAAALLDAQPVEGPIRYGRERVELTPRPLGREARVPRATHHLLGREPVAAERRQVETRAQGAALLERLREIGTGPIRATFDVEAWALGDVALVSVPGELFASLGASIVATSTSTSPTLVLGYANGYVGYLPDRAAYANGTYEALASPFGADAGERVARVSCDLVRRTRAGSTVGAGDE